MDQENINRIESYLNGELSSDEKRQFDQEIVDNSELAAIYHEYLLAMDAVDHQVESELKDQFESWDNVDAKNGRSAKLFPIMWKVAASFILLAGIYMVFFQAGRDFETREQIALSAYELPSPPERTMGLSYELWESGLNAYEASDFKTAAADWSAIEDLDFETQYYLAHAFYNIENYDEAIDIFMTISESRNANNKTSEWYLLLSYLAADKRNLSNNLLKKIIRDQHHPFLKNAHDLEKSLKNLEEAK